MNTIPQEQNKQRQLDRLAAQRQLYSDAKSIQNISIILSIPLALIFTIFVAFFPRFQVYGAFFAIFVTFFDILIFSRWQKSLQEQAAKIQQLFDCDVLQLDWSKLSSGSRPDPEIIISSSKKYIKKYLNYTELENWYPVTIDKLPILQARIICQRSNVYWDYKLKRLYCNALITILIAMTIIVFLIGLTSNFKLEQFILAIIAPLVPMYVLILRHYIENSEAVNRLERLKENFNSLWQAVVHHKISIQDIESESYSLQNQIYDNRRLSPSVFDWLYSKLKSKNEEEMNKTAEAMIQDLYQSP